MSRLAHGTKYLNIIAAKETWQTKFEVLK